MKLNKIILITGISASGKDFLLDNSKSNFKQGIEVFALGSLIHADMKHRYPNIHGEPKSLRQATMENIRLSTHNATDFILSRSSTTVINGHVAYKRQESVVVDIDMNLRLAPRDYIFIQSDPEDILYRRITSEKDRVIDSIDSIVIQQEIARAAISALASRIGARMTTVLNNDEVQKNAALIAKIVNDE